MLDFFIDFIADPILDFFLLYKRSREDFLTGLRLDALAFAFLAAAVICLTRHRIVPGILCGAAAVYFIVKSFRHTAECMKKNRE